MTRIPPLVTVDARWERASLRHGRDETALRINLRGQRPAGHSARRAPVDIAFVLDRSGSMAGPKLELAKQAVVSALDLIDAEDRVSLVVFDSHVEVVLPLMPATHDTRNELRRRLTGFLAGSATALADGWLIGCQQLAAAGVSPGERAQRAILLTDGQANVGITDPAELAHHAAEIRQRGIATTTVGVGHDYDELLLAGMAEAGGGTFEHIREPGRLAAFFRKELDDLTHVAVLQPRLDLTMPRGLRAWLLNRYPNHRDVKVITVDLRDIGDGDEVDLVFRVTHRGNLDDTSRFVRANLTAIEPETGERMHLEIVVPPLAFVSDAEAEAAPVDHIVGLARAREEAIAGQQEALRLDREGRHQESRTLFARSSALLADADATAARTGYAGLDAATLREYQVDLADAASLAAAPATSLDEETHKSRTARHTNRSRGGRRDEH